MLRTAIFSSVGASLSAGEFAFGTAAADGNDFILYNSTDGTLFYDADGNGATAAIQFAKVSAGTTLSADDFIVA